MNLRKKFFGKSAVGGERKSVSNDEHGQALNIDLIAAGFTFLLITGLGITTITNNTNAEQSQAYLQEMHLDAVNAVDTLLSDQNCLRGGLANEKIRLSLDKIACFNSADYASLKENLSIESYEFTAKIFDANTIYLQKGTTTQKQAVAVQRAAIIGNSTVRVVFVLYEK